MSPLLAVDPADRCDEWMTIDLRNEREVEAIVVIPLYGRNHHAGMDCWCNPNVDDGVIVHVTTH
jgi:hypothetical protein